MTSRMLAALACVFVLGGVLPTYLQAYLNLSQAEIENHDSRIYLGVHWRFDQDQGFALGRKIGDHVVERFLLPR